MKATDSELNEHQLCAGLSGFNRVASRDIMNKRCDYSTNQDCVMGQHTSTARVFDIMNDCVVSNLDYL